MKKILSFFLSALMCITFSSCALASEADTDFAQRITMQIGNSDMTVDGKTLPIDSESEETVPVVIDNRTLLPVRSVVEAMGGEVLWDNDTQTATLTRNETEIKLTIGESTAYLNDEAKTLDTTPIIMNNRTMLPIRFIAENFGYNVDWENETQTVIIEKASSATDAPTMNNPSDDTLQTGKNILITYFSRAGENWQVGYVEKGNTAVIADYITARVDADVFEIVAEEPYPEGYNDTLERVNRERDNDERPAFVGEIENIDQYDTVFIGYPIWYGGLPMVMYTFLEQYDMAGKTIIPFSTHGGSGWGSTLSELRKLCPEAKLEDGFSTPGTNARSAENEVERWLDGMDLPTPSDNTDEKAIMALYNELHQAMIDKDVDTIRKIRKNTKTVTHISGKVQTLDEWLSDVENEEMKYYSIEMVDPQLTINGNRARLVCSNVIDARIYGSRGTWTLSADVTFEKVNGEWEIA